MRIPKAMDMKTKPAMPRTTDPMRQLVRQSGRRLGKRYAYTLPLVDVLARSVRRHRGIEAKIMEQRFTEFDRHAWRENFARSIVNELRAPLAQNENPK